MNYLDFEAGNKAYKLRLNTRNIVALEKRLGCNPMMIFGKDGERFPTVEDMVNVLWASLQQYQHGISTDDAYDIFDAYLAEGHNPMEFLPILFDIYKVSGLIPKEAKIDEEDNAVKN